MELRGSDFGSEFDVYGELDFGDTQSPAEGFVAGREFLWDSSTSETDVEAIRANISCFETLQHAEALHDRIAAQVFCIDGEGREVEGYVVTLPVQLGDESFGRFCPGYGPETETSLYNLIARSRVGDATVNFLWQSSEELTPDTATVEEFTRFATAFLTTAADHSSVH